MRSARRRRGLAVRHRPGGSHLEGVLGMPDGSLSSFDSFRKLWRSLSVYERFEQVVSRLVMLLISAVIVYSVILTTITLFKQVTLDPEFLDRDALKDVFGAILTILILIEFNHSIAMALTKRSGVLQARHVVLIAILVIARKVILLDFATASFETLIGIAAIAIAAGVLYWLISVKAHEALGASHPPPDPPRAFEEPRNRWS
jgi:uncharacterized membrane protein (DUF373 family)